MNVKGLSFLHFYTLESRKRIREKYKLCRICTAHSMGWQVCVIVDTLSDFGIYSVPPSTDSLPPQQTPSFPKVRQLTDHSANLIDLTAF